MSNDTLHRGSHRPFDWRAHPDLAGVAAYAVVAALVLAVGDGLPAWVRVPLALPLLVFVPGYTTVTALVPATRDAARAGHGRGVGGIATGLSPLERLTLSTVASVALVPMVALAANVAVGVTLVPVLVGVVLLTLATAAVAAHRRGTRPAAEAPGDATGGPSRSVGSRLGGAIPRDATTVTAIAIAAVLLATSLAVALTGAPAGGNSAEFYLVDDAEDGRFAPAGYPDRVVQGEPVSVPVGVEHAGDEPREYTVVVVHEHVADDGDAARVVSTEELERTTLRVEPGEPTVEEVTVEPTSAGRNVRLAFLLYRGDAPADPDRASAHRAVHLPVEVVPADG